MDQIHHFVLIPLRQGASRDQHYTRVAVRSNQARAAIKSYIDQQRETGGFPTPVRIRRVRSRTAPFPPVFQGEEVFFIYPAENGTGTPQD